MLKKKEGFAGQRSIVLPRKILAGVCHSNRLLERLYVTDIGYYPKAQYHYRQRVHGVDQHILIYCVDGQGRAQVSKKKYELEPGTFLIIPAGDQHWYSASEDNSWTIYWVHFKGLDAGQLAVALQEKGSRHKGSVGFQPRRIQLFEDIYACLERGYGNDNLCYANVCLYHYIASFLYQDKFNLTDNRHPEDAVELSINYMQQNLSSLVSLEELSAAINFSASHYSA
ncbi:MAG TPA: AraC family ligand binding domain-containing protein, partial [Puia sp.]|nr:AraC family ligand binding domain-containing protein [Puia sp.]